MFLQVLIRFVFKYPLPWTERGRGRRPRDLRGPRGALARYDDLPDTPEAIEAWLQPPAPPDAADRNGKFVVRDGATVFNFGKHRGRPLAAVAAEAPDYLRWLLQGDFPDDAKALVREALGR